jgi:predicted tellurium resistance membrane protein TerC
MLDLAWFDVSGTCPTCGAESVGGGAASGPAPLFSYQSALALLTLTALEVVLGVDNIVFLAILVGKLPPEQRPRARTVGLALAMLMRIGLLFALGALLSLKSDLFKVFGMGFSGKELILLAGGLFLIGKATHEIHDKLEGTHEDDVVRKGAASFGKVLVQIVLIDAVFSIDSVLTAGGMADHLSIMVAAVVISVLIMMVSAGHISRFVEKHPTIKMLALSFLLLIGVLLVAEGLGGHLDKGYVYFAMAFSLFVEVLNMRMMKKAAKVVQLNQPRLDDAAPAGR